jgi:hypothetical protein
VFFKELASLCTRYLHKKQNLVAYETKTDCLLLIVKFPFELSNLLLSYNYEYATRMCTKKKAQKATESLLPFKSKDKY